MASRKKKSTFSSSRNIKRTKESVDLSGFKDGSDDEHIDSSDDDIQTPSFRDENDDESEEENLDVKKVRLAREYLAAIEEDIGDVGSDDDVDESSDDDGSNDDAVSRKLQRARLQRQGALERNYADRVSDSLAKLRLPLDAVASNTAELEGAAWINAGIVSLCHGAGHDLTPTCVALAGSEDEKAISGSKDHSVLLWDVETQTRVATLSERWEQKNQKHRGSKHDNDRNRTSGQVLAVACSNDGKYVAVGRRDATVSIFDIRAAAGKNDCCVQTFTGHKGAITSLAFRSQTHQLFTASADRCIRHYNLDEMLYLETLYGHQFGITGIDCHRAERPISVAADRTARAWKLAEDSHLIFRGGSKVSSADAVTVLKDDYFVTGHQDGAVSLWSTEKKRAVASIPQAHGTVGNCGLGRGVVSINCVKGSDVVATGSSDGYLRLWKVCTGGGSGSSSGESNATNRKGSRGGTIESIGEIPIHGFINGIAISSKAKFCVAAVGQEHRCGRWERVSRAKNRLAIVQLQTSSDTMAAADTKLPSLSLD
jgi:ribosomal RNA-processing protein 9